MNKEVLYVYVVAGCVLMRNGKFLMVQEKKTHAYGLWNVTAGKVDKGETIKQTAIRETQEESGYKVRLGELIDIYQDYDEGPVVHHFRAKIIGGELNFPTSELLDVKWMTYQEIEILNNQGKIRSKCVFASIKKLQLENNINNV